MSDRPVMASELQSVAEELRGARNLLGTDGCAVLVHVANALERVSMAKTPTPPVETAAVAVGERPTRKCLDCDALIVARFIRCWPCYHVANPNAGDASACPGCPTCAPIAPPAAETEEPFIPTPGMVVMVKGKPWLVNVPPRNTGGEVRLTWTTGEHEYTHAVPIGACTAMVPKAMLSAAEKERDEAISRVDSAKKMGQSLASSAGAKLDEARAEILATWDALGEHAVAGPESGPVSVVTRAAIKALEAEVERMRHTLAGYNAPAHALALKENDALRAERDEAVAAIRRVVKACEDSAQTRAMLGHDIANECLAALSRPATSGAR